MWPFRKDKKTETYDVMGYCNNCLASFHTDVPKGTVRKGHIVDCPNCNLKVILS